MDKNEKVLNDTHEENVVDSLTPEEQEELEQYEPETDEPETVEDEEPEVVEPEQEEEQSPEQNAIYKKMRLKAQEEAKRELESERQRIEAEREELNRLQYEREAQEVESRVYNELLTNDNIEAKEYELGVNRDVAIKLLKLEGQKLVNDERSKVSEKIKRNQSQKDDLKNDPDEVEYFRLLEKDVESIIKANPGLDLHFEMVYANEKFRRRKELNKLIKNNTEKKTLANVQDRMRRKPVSSDAGSDDNVNPSAVLSKTGIDMASVFGVDPSAVAKRVKTAKLNRRR